jgi:hypothetical protein
MWQNPATVALTWQPQPVDSMPHPCDKLISHYESMLYDW